MLTAQEVEQKQNAEPTDWSRFDQNLDTTQHKDNRFAEDHKLYVRFYLKPRLNVEKSTAANRPIYEPCEYVEIMMPGEKHNIVQRPAWSQDYQRFSKQYEAFKAGKEEQDSGTPLNALPFLSESLIEELKYFKIHTVEKLANLTDTVMQNFMGARDLSQQAQKYLANLNNGDTLRNDNLELKRRVAELEAKLNKGAKG